MMLGPELWPSSTKTFDSHRLISSIAQYLIDLQEISLRKEKHTVRPCCQRLFHKR